ncbi:MAG: hypothetical protein ACI8VR_001237 [Candidatus Azotimanducaceae bacterium]|jgi:hypothetical protein
MTPPPIEKLETQTREEIDAKLKAAAKGSLGLAQKTSNVLQYHSCSPKI